MRFTQHQNSSVQDPLSGERYLNVDLGGPGSGYLNSYTGTNDGKLIEAFISNAAHVKRDLIPVVLAAPHGLTYFKDAGFTRRMQTTYRELIEVQTEKIDGLTSTLTVNTDEHAIGRAGQKQKETIGSTLAISEPVLTWRERVNKPIIRFWDTLVRYLDMDPETRRPLIAVESDDIRPGFTYTPDMKAGIVAFIEPDIAMKTVIEGYICYNFYPIDDIGEITSSMDIEGDGEMIVYDIKFSAITSNNAGTRRMLQKYLDNMSVLNFTPDNLIVWDEKDPLYQGSNHDGGYDNLKNLEENPSRAGQVDGLTSREVAQQD